ncbi:MAG: J domain-containing protein [Acidimicrobiia bacterium]
MPTHYEVLGVPPDASEEQVRHAYRALAKEAHPDRSGDATRFQVITEAYEVLSDPVRRATYDRRLRPVAAAPAGASGARAAAGGGRRRRYGRYAVVPVALLVVAGIVAWATGATSQQSVGDECLVGTWRGEAFGVPFRGVLDGREVDVLVRGGAGVTLVVDAAGIVRADYSAAAPLVGRQGAYRVEGVYLGTTRERWRATDGTVTLRATNVSDLSFRATINGRPPDQPLGPAVADRNYRYTCTATTLELGPYRYVRL